MFGSGNTSPRGSIESSIVANALSLVLHFNLEELALIVHFILGMTCSVV